MGDTTTCSAEMLATWRATCARHARVSAALDRELAAEHTLTTSEFDVLEWLATEPDDAHRMQDIAEAVHLSQSALSRLIGRLEKDALVSRCMCADDRRGIYAHLTPAGRERYDAALGTHRRVLAQTL